MPEAPPCVYCRKRPAESPWTPFCSQRCKMADLGRWLTEDYRVSGPAAGLDEPDEDTGEVGEPDGQAD